MKSNTDYTDIFSLFLETILIALFIGIIVYYFDSMYKLENKVNQLEYKIYNIEHSIIESNNKEVLDKMSAVYTDYY